MPIETQPTPHLVEVKERKRGKYAVKDTSGATVAFKFSNGTTREIDPAGFSPEVQAAYLKHGISQKHGDSYASAKSVEEAISMFDKSVEQVMTKGFEGRAPGAAKETESVEMLAQAVFLALTSEAPMGYGKATNLDAVLAQVKAGDASARRSYRNDPKVAYHLAGLKNKGAEIAAAFGL
jgi:hypothetical protein